MSDTPTPNGPGDDIQPIQLQDEMERSFIDYAMSVIMSRALPDVRDGLKPVHRRIIWDMDQQGFRPNRAHVKSARVTGDTMAKYHPHGNSAIYDALVRMAQPFSLRHTLIDFHGNYGSPDFGAAAERYTECRLDALAMQMLADIDEETVDMVANYDNTTEEPSVLPARFPNLLVNGSQGIAVGMATSIPPHNLGEVCRALVRLIDEPGVSMAELLQIIPGPDFPTGGVVMGREALARGYLTGRSTITLRARAHVEEFAKNRSRIVVTEIPYQQSASSGAATVQFKEAVLSLRVTPLITPDNRLILDLSVKKDSVGKVIVSSGGLNVPAIDTSSLTTSVLVGDGQTVVLGGIHMSPIPQMPYSLLYHERVIRSVANNTRRDGEDFLELAAKIPIATETEVFPLAQANRALNALRHDAVRGAAVLVLD